MFAILKLGGSILCDKNIPYSINWENLENIAIEIKEAIEYYKSKNEDFKLIIVHGGGSFGHPVAKKYLKDGKFEDMEKGYWEIQKAMRKFNNIVIEELQNFEIPAVSIQASSFITFDNDSNLHFDTNAVEKMLDKRLIPVIHGDIVIDEKTDNFKIFSGDHALPFLSKKLNPDLSLHASDVDGVWDLNFKIIENINSKNIEDVLKSLKPSNKEDVTGGMHLKVMECYNLGIKTIIFNGNKKRNIYNALLKNVKGTLIN
ncbi:isopentenyl phosphate kinase [Methanococcus maripaludis]|uniref:Isopentenyl phosphate kinase n=1 Tax=Methanococcus maripaludis TaxID=39152 RepID=A0A7J9RZC6_METMI|nr:isopentenyl phosphate kinase [Methanococcus maripaludis]MBB6067399.1 isopentenyl phosphate kinase [Methanococcus maripaludis]MBM7409688.1 isopentenyl phosphate kinase [Methanococcus maripaludis]MBP2219560.1 isopentenyl phosphate kinase [Methanococcus maripaludis]